MISRQNTEEFEMIMLGVLINSRHILDNDPILVRNSDF